MTGKRGRPTKKVDAQAESLRQRVRKCREKKSQSTKPKAQGALSNAKDADSPLPMGAMTPKLATEHQRPVPSIEIEHANRAKLHYFNEMQKRRLPIKWDIRLAKARSAVNHAKEAAATNAEAATIKASQAQIDAADARVDAADARAKAQALANEASVVAAEGDLAVEAKEVELEMLQLEMAESLEGEFVEDEWVWYDNVNATEP